MSRGSTALQVHVVEPCRQRGLPDPCRLQLFREHSCRADLVHGKADERMTVERQMRLALPFCNKHLGCGLPGKYALISII